MERTKGTEIFEKSSKANSHLLFRVLNATLITLYQFSYYIHSIFDFQYAISEFPRISTFDSIVHDSWEDIDTEYMGYSPDISHSWEEDCEILHLDSNVYSYLPGELIGKKVLDVVITSTGEGFRYRKVCIIFGQPHIRAEKDFRGKMNLLTPHTSTVTIDQCRHVRILDWYHPLYLGFDEK